MLISICNYLFPCVLVVLQNVSKFSRQIDILNFAVSLRGQNNGYLNEIFTSFVFRFYVFAYSLRRLRSDFCKQNEICIL